MGLFFLAIGITLVVLSFVTEDWNSISIVSIGIGQLCAGAFMLIIYFVENKRQYLTLRNGELIKNTLIPKNIKLTEVTSISEVAGDLRFIMEKR